LPALVGRGGGVEAGAAAFPGLPGDGEVADQEDRAAGLADVEGV
jgi:hypothetical protein